MYKKHSPEVAALRVLSALLMLVAVLACGGEAQDTSVPSQNVSPTATAAPTLQPTTPEATATNVPPTRRPTSSVSSGFREFAGEIDAAIMAGDLDFFRDRVLLSTLTCTDVAVQNGVPGCTSVGQEVTGLSSGLWRAGGALAPLDEAMEMLARMWNQQLSGESDQFGGSGPHVYALGTATFGKRDAAAILTALIERPTDMAGSGPLRVAAVSFWRSSEGSWRLSGLVFAFVLAEELLRPDPVASDTIDGWERFQP